MAAARRESPRANGTDDHDHEGGLGRSSNISVINRRVQPTSAADSFISENNERIRSDLTRSSALAGSCHISALLASCTRSHDLGSFTEGKIDADTHFGCELVGQAAHFVRMHGNFMGLKPSTRAWMDHHVDIADEHLPLELAPSVAFMHLHQACPATAKLKFRCESHDRESG